jgi:magnesium-protoporphyrin O-methyltransferase
VGTIHHVLLDRGFARATQIDASQAYLAVAAAEAERCGHRGRVTFAHADFRALAPTTPPADVVTLDRVVCCDPDYRSLLADAADHAQHFLAFTYPHARWYTRLFVATKNAWRRILGQPFRAFIHPPAAMIAVLEAHGLRRRWAGETRIWRAELFERAA